MQEQRERSRAEAKFYKFDQDSSEWCGSTSANLNSAKNFAGYNLKVNDFHPNRKLSMITGLLSKCEGVDI